MLYIRILSAVLGNFYFGYALAYYGGYALAYYGIT